MPQGLLQFFRLPSGEFAEMMDALHEAGSSVFWSFISCRTCLPGRFWTFFTTAAEFSGRRVSPAGEGSWIDAVTEDPLLEKDKADLSELRGRTPGPNGRQQICRNLAEMNMGYEELMRRFLKGDPGCTEGSRLVSAAEQSGLRLYQLFRGPGWIYHDGHGFLRTETQ